MEDMSEPEPNYFKVVEPPIWRAPMIEALSAALKPLADAYGSAANGKASRREVSGLYRRICKMADLINHIAADEAKFMSNIVGVSVEENANPR
jgi:hypothetical protein